jgi:hypothetical protein
MLIYPDPLNCAQLAKEAHVLITINFYLHFGPFNYQDIDEIKIKYSNS